MEKEIVEKPDKAVQFFLSHGAYKKLKVAVINEEVTLQSKLEQIVSEYLEDYDWDELLQDDE